MAKRIPPLSETAVRTAKPTDTQYKLHDGFGMFLLVTPSGGKLWRLRYRLPGRKESQVSLGQYPEVGLAEARQLRTEFRRMICNGQDPAEYKRKAAIVASGKDLFESVVLSWHEYHSQGWTEKHAQRLKSRLTNDVFPFIGNIPIDRITSQDLLSVLKRVEPRSLETAHRLKIAFGQIFAYAMANGYCATDPTYSLRRVLMPQRKQHYASVTDPRHIGPLLRTIDAYHGSVVVRAACRLLPLVFTRPGELRQAEWPEFDLDAGLWSIPAERMKMKQPHLVPLSHQAVAILREVQQVSGGGRHVFPTARTGRCISDMAINSALRTMGIGKETITGHGFRAMARTLLDEALHYRIDYIEHQLAHAVRDPLGRAYNRTTHLAERTEMMQAWADYLDRLKSDITSL